MAHTKNLARIAVLVGRLDDDQQEEALHLFSEQHATIEAQGKKILELEAKNAELGVKNEQLEAQVLPILNLLLSIARAITRVLLGNVLPESWSREKSE